MGNKGTIARLDLVKWKNTAFFDRNVAANKSKRKKKKFALMLFPLNFPLSGLENNLFKMFTERSFCSAFGRMQDLHLYSTMNWAGNISKYIALKQNCSRINSVLLRWKAQAPGGTHQNLHAYR